MSRRWTTTLTSKGQITVPRWIARRLRLTRGTRLTIRVTGQDEFVAATVNQPSARGKEARDR